MSKNQIAWTVSNDTIGAVGDGMHMTKCSPTFIGTGQRDESLYTQLAAAFDSHVKKALASCPHRRKAEHLTQGAAEAEAAVNAIAAEMARLHAVYQDAVEDGKLGEAEAKHIELASLGSRKAVAEARLAYLKKSAADAAEEHGQTRANALRSAKAEIYQAVTQARRDALTELAETAGPLLSQIIAADRVIIELQRVDADAGIGLGGRPVKAA